jgi:hypothetical protein
MGLLYIAGRSGLALLFEEEEHKGHEGYTKNTKGCFLSSCPSCNLRVLCAPVFCIKTFDENSRYLKLHFVCTRTITSWNRDIQ